MAEVTFDVDDEVQQVLVDVLDQVPLPKWRIIGDMGCARKRPDAPFRMSDFDIIDSHHEKVLATTAAKSRYEPGDVVDVLHEGLFWKLTLAWKVKKIGKFRFGNSGKFIPAVEGDKCDRDFARCTVWYGNWDRKGNYLDLECGVCEASFRPHVAAKLDLRSMVDKKRLEMIDRGANICLPMVVETLDSLIRVVIMNDENCQFYMDLDGNLFSYLKVEHFYGSLSRFRREYPQIIHCLPKITLTDGWQVDGWLKRKADGPKESSTATSRLHRFN